MISDEQGKKWLLQKLYDDGWANAIIFVAWSVLVYMLAINGAFKD